MRVACVAVLRVFARVVLRVVLLLSLFVLRVLAVCVRVRVLLCVCVHPPPPSHSRVMKSDSRWRRRSPITVARYL